MTFLVHRAKTGTIKYGPDPSPWWILTVTSLRWGRKENRKFGLQRALRHFQIARNSTAPEHSGSPSTIDSNRFGRCRAGCTCVRQLQSGYPWTHRLLFWICFHFWVGQFIHAEMVVENLEPCAAKTKSWGSDWTKLFNTLRTCLHSPGLIWADAKDFSMANKRGWRKIHWGAHVHMPCSAVHLHNTQLTNRMETGSQSPKNVWMSCDMCKYQKDPKRVSVLQLKLKIVLKSCRSFCACGPWNHLARHPVSDQKQHHEQAASPPEHNGCWGFT